MKKFILIVICNIVLLSLIVPLPLHAQTQPEPRVIHTVTKDNKDHLGLSILFTFVDSNNQPLSTDDVKDYREGTIQLTTSQSSPVTATIQPATTPIKIALVIDSSGSMGPVIENVKQAAIKFADATPSNAEVAVFSFSDEVVQKQGFTAKERIQLVKNAITDITARKAGEGDTCLYKAAFQAVNAFTNDPKANPEERHAVVLFTDGKDREAGGKACGDMQAQNVIGQANLADRIPIQIHTIGLCEQAGCANVDQGALNNLARSTFALSKVGGVGALDTLFQTILQGLDSQWFARSNVLAIQGKNRATLNFSATVQNAARDFSIPTDEFYSPKDYTTHAAVQIADRGYDPKQDVYILSLTVTDPQTVGKITTQFFDTEKKSTVITSTQTIEQISATMQITQTATGLQPGREYCSQIRAETKDGTPLKNDKGDTVLASECGKYDPPQQVSVSFKIRAGVLNWQQHSFDITLGDISSPGGANLVYEGYINEGPRPVIAINHAFLPKEALVLKESLIRITVPETETQALQQSQAPKEYSLHLKLSKEGDTQGTEQDFKFTAVAPPPPTFVQRLLAALGNPPVLIGILAIILIGAAIVVYPKLRAKQTVLPRPALPQNAPTVLYTPPKLASRASGEVTVLSSKETIRVTPPAPKMRLRIKVARTLDPKEQREEDISDFPCVLGREVGKEAGKRYFVITGDNEISRVHAEITVLGNKFFITDRSSTNGTFIGDTRLEKEKQVSLTGKTAIRLGTFTSLEIEPRAG